MGKVVEDSEDKSGEANIELSAQSPPAGRQSRKLTMKKQLLRGGGRILLEFAEGDTWRARVWDEFGRGDLGKVVVEGIVTG